MIFSTYVGEFGISHFQMFADKFINLLVQTSFTITSIPFSDGITINIHLTWVLHEFDCRIFALSRQSAPPESFVAIQTKIQIYLGKNRTKYSFSNSFFLFGNGFKSYHFFPGKRKGTFRITNKHL